MKAWLKIACLGLAVGAFAVACTVTTDDDPDSGIGGANVSGGTGGTSGSGGTATGGVAPTGGAGGETTTGGTGGGGPNDCETCLATNCADELAACQASTDSDTNGDPDCIQEFMAVQNCLSESSAYYRDAITGCAAEAAVDTVILGSTNDLLTCAQPEEQIDNVCAAECLDFNQGEGGAGGAP